MGRPRSNRSALSLTLAGMDVPEGAAALVTLAETLAVAVDKAPGSAALAKEYRATLIAVMEACTADDVDDEGAQLVALVRTPVGDAKDA